EIIEQVNNPGTGCPPTDVPCDDPGDTHCNGIQVAGPDGGNEAGIWTVTVDALDDGGDPIIYELVASEAGGGVRSARQLADNVFEIRLSAGSWTVEVTVDDNALCDDAAANNSCSEGPFEVVRGAGRQLGHWCLDEGKGLVAGDAERTSDAMLVNMDENAWVEGPLYDDDGALVFDGIDDYVIAKDSKPFDIHFSDHSWSVWFRTAEPGLNGGILQKGPTNDNWDHKDHRGGRSLEIRNGVLGVDVGWVGFLGATTPVDDGEWHHGTMTVEMDTNGKSDTMILYVDGVLDAVRDDWDIASQVPLVTGDLKIGWVGDFEDAAAPYFTGDIADVRFFNFALGEDEVFELAGQLEAQESDCDVGPPETRFVRGDADSNGSINLTDGIVILNFLFLGSTAPNCLDAADSDDDGGERPTLTDAVIVFAWLFSGGAAPREPSPQMPSYAVDDCGSDATEDMMGCAVVADVCNP
ncbi:MAG: LamG domain-containing protein, partial [Planctomycetota bacterium]|nr:LamG domain-containing protein [Planctomycetota bacterium]